MVLNLGFKELEVGKVFDRCNVTYKILWGAKLVNIPYVFLWLFWLFYVVNSTFYVVNLNFYVVNSTFFMVNLTLCVVNYTLFMWSTRLFIWSIKHFWYGQRDLFTVKYRLFIQPGNALRDQTQTKLRKLSSPRTLFEAFELLKKHESKHS